MGFTCGIIGLPNVGKSTLFNAITKLHVEASNYPFCTIEPNKGIVPVPDYRLNFLSNWSSSKSSVPATVEFIDIAGLVKGASKGEGLGNKFLGHIRQVQAICQVVRLFSDANVTHVGNIAPLNDLDIIHTELALADMESVNKKKINLEKLSRSQKGLKNQIAFLEKIKFFLSDGILLNTIDISEEPQEHLDLIKDLCLLTAKPMLIIANIDENQVTDYINNPHYQELKKYCESHRYQLIVLSAKFELEISELDDENAKELLASEGLEQSGLDRLIVAGYNLLDLITYFTTGEKETRAWTIKKGTLAPQAAGVIHSDFEKGFIKAETTSFEDFKLFKNYNQIREKGKIRMEGKEYLVKDGDVFNFKFNV